MPTPPRRCASRGRPVSSLFTVSPSSPGLKQLGGWRTIAVSMRRRRSSRRSDDGIGAARRTRAGHSDLLALGLGRMSEAIAELEQVARLVEEHEMRHPVEVPWAQDFVEALCAKRSPEDAARVLARLQFQAERARLPSALAAASRCRGLARRRGRLRCRLRAGSGLSRSRADAVRARANGALLRRAAAASRTQFGRTGSSTRTALERSNASTPLHGQPGRAPSLPRPGRPKPEGREGRIRLPDAARAPGRADRRVVERRTRRRRRLSSSARRRSRRTCTAIYVKLGIRSRTELARLLARARMLD